MSDQRYPVGRFVFEGEVTPVRRDGWIAEVAETPGLMRAAVLGLSDAQIETPYREGGWKVGSLTTR